MLYHFYDLYHAALTPARFAANMTRMALQHPFSPTSYIPAGRSIAAGAELFERMTRRFGKPEFGLHETTIGGRKVNVEEKIVHAKPFCNLLNFHRKTQRNDPKVLIVAPVSGHFATLLRGTVEALLPHHDVYITEWLDARQVPLIEGQFSLDDYIAYIMEFIRLLGPDTHVIAVCQPAVPVLAAASLLASMDDPNQPRSMTLMGGPIDTRISKTAVTELAEKRSLEWFEHSVTAEVPFYYPGAYRKVYPGFIQLTGFMTMNLDRHVSAHFKLFEHLVDGDGDSADAHKKFYNEYLAVMDIPAEFYLQTVDIVFQRHLLPKNKMTWTDPLTKEVHKVEPSKIKKTALLTVEGELDDISALGQTLAAHDLCTNIPANMKFHHYQESVGHYGIFNGRRWRNFIMPRLRWFMRQHDSRCSTIPKTDIQPEKNIRPEQWDKNKHNVKAYKKEQTTAKL